MGHTYVRPWQKPIVLDADRKQKMVESYRGGSGQHQAKMIGGGPVFSRETAERFALNLYNDDVAVCMDADTGVVLWKTRFFSHFKGQTGSYHNSPCIDDGRLYVLTAGEVRVLCLDAMTGELLWDHYNTQREVSLRQTIAMRKRLLSRYKKDMGNAGIQHSIVVDGYLVCSAGVFDGKTGERIRDGAAVATRWVHKGKEYLLTGDACYDVRTGKELWRAEGVSFGMGRNSGGNPPVTENHMVAWVGRKGWVGYEINLEGATEIWSIPDLKHSTGGAVIHKGYAVTGASDEKGRCLVAVDVKTGEIVGKLHYDQKGSTNFPSSSLNNLWCGVSSAVAMDGHVFWRRFRSGGGGVTMLTVPAEGREFGVAIKDGPLLGYSHTPAAADGRLFVRMKGYMRCLDFRKDPPPVRDVPPDPACRELAGAVAKLGSAYRSERSSAVEELRDSLEAAMLPRLVALLSDGKYTTARAAEAVLADASSMGTDCSEALKSFISTSAEKLPSTRLGLALHALHMAAPEDAAGVTRGLLRNRATMVRTCEALNDPLFANDSGLLKAVLAELGAALARVDAATLDAIGEAMWYLDLEPDVTAPLVEELIAAMQRTDSQPFFMQRALLIALETCDDEAMLNRAAEFAVSLWPERRGNAGWGGSTTFPLAVLDGCPPEVAQVALPKLVQWPHHAEMTLIRKIGAAAIAAMEREREASSGKASQLIDKALNELRGEERQNDARP
jgi:outer membrane protein assembly factor BamB